MKMTLKKKQEKMMPYGMTAEPRKTFGIKPKKILHDIKSEEALEEIKSFKFNEQDKRLS